MVPWAAQQIPHLSVWLMHVRWWLWSRNMECYTFQRKCYQGCYHCWLFVCQWRNKLESPRLQRNLPQKVPIFSGIMETKSFFSWCALFTRPSALSMFPPISPHPSLNNTTPLPCAWFVVLQLMVFMWNSNCCFSSLFNVSLSSGLYIYNL